MSSWNPRCSPAGPFCVQTPNPSSGVDNETVKSRTTAWTNRSITKLRPHADDKSDRYDTQWWSFENDVSESTSEWHSPLSLLLQYNWTDSRGRRIACCVCVCERLDCRYIVARFLFYKSTRLSLHLRSFDCSYSPYRYIEANRNLDGGWQR